MELLPGESVVSASDIEYLTLTTHRVRFDGKASGIRLITSITLDAVSSCSVVSKSYPLLLLVAVIVGGFGVLQLTQGANDQDSMYVTYGLLLGGVALIVAYFLTRAVEFAISSPRQAITISARGIAPDILVAFVDKVEEAKLRYLGKVTK